jgi:hypothetical protein
MQVSARVRVRAPCSVLCAHSATSRQSNGRMGTSSEDCQRRRLDRLQLWQGPRRLEQERLGRRAALAEPRGARLMGCQGRVVEGGCAQKAVAVDARDAKDSGRGGQGCCRPESGEGRDATRKGTGCQKGQEGQEKRRLVLPMRLHKFRFQGGLQGVRSAKAGGRNREGGRHGGGLQCSQGGTAGKGGQGTQ